MNSSTEQTQTISQQDMPQTSIAFETCSAHRAIATLPGSKRCKTQGDDVFLSDATNRTEASHSQGVLTVPSQNDRPPEANYGVQNVNQNHISRLMRDILVFIDGPKCVERGELVAALYDIGGRRYCGYYVDPCFSKTESRKYNQCYKRAQPAMTRTLKKLEIRGLIRLIHHGRYVKRLSLTPQGKIVSSELIKKQKTERNEP